jgi:hypothetical protein
VNALSGADREFLESEGRRIAATLGSISSAIIIGENGTVAALVAVAIARSEAARRHVALGDLVGELAPLYAIAGGDDAIGLSECFRDGLPLNDIARPAPDLASLFVLPSGAPPVATEKIYGNERWPRLIGGFRQAGALMLLVASADAPGIDALVGAAEGVIVAGAREESVARFPVLARVGAMPVSAAPEREGHASAARRLTIVTVSLGLAIVVVTVAAGWIYRGALIARFRRTGVPEVAGGCRCAVAARDGAPGAPSAGRHSGARRAVKPCGFECDGVFRRRSRSGEHPPGCKFGAPGQCRIGAASGRNDCSRAARRRVVVVQGRRRRLARSRGSRRIARRVA